MKTKRRVLAILLACIMVISMLPTAFAAEDEDYSVSVLKPATCTTTGIGKRVDNATGKASYYVIPLGDHTQPEEGVVTVDPDCGNDGSVTYTCTVCGQEIVEVLPATGEHSWVDIAYSDATCTEPAYAGGQICEVCGEVNPEVERQVVRYSEPLGHKWVLDEDAENYVAPTCTEEGWGVYVCANDPSHVEERAIPATGHTPGDIEYAPATCTENGKSVVKCTVCGEILEEDDLGDVDPATGHDWDDGVVVEPTCVEGGYTLYTCKTCGEERIEDETPANADGHDWVVTVLKEADCKTGATGIGKYVCSLCNTSKYAVIPAEHVWDNGRVITEATCTEAGEIEYTCTVCGETKTEEIPATDHSWGEGITTKEATCGEDGEIEYTCTVCGETKTEVIPATGDHTWVESLTDATCTEPAYITQVCSVCGTVNPEAEKIPVGDSLPLGHTYELDTSDEEYVEATCTTGGVNVYVCATCGDRYTEEVEATGHTLGEPEYTPATCTENGKSVIKCTVCGEVIEEDDLGELDPATGHDWDDGVVVEATCSEGGYTLYTCKTCNETRREDETPVNPDAHAYALTATLKDASCETGTTGIGKYTCSLCGVSKYAVIPAEHDWNEGEVIKEATCEEAGETKYTCNVCGLEEVREVEALGHNYVMTVTKDATCVEDGEALYVCETCYDYYIEVIPATGEHTWVDGDGYIDATCTEPAYAGGQVCAVCGAVNPDSEMVPVIGSKPLGHDWVAVESDENVAATCTEGGVQAYECSRCGETKTETVPATGHTPGEEVFVPATCEENAKSVVYCEVCGEVIEEVDLGSLGGEYLAVGAHVWDNGVVVEATCQHGGYTVYTCENCGETRFEDETPVNPDNHEWVLDSTLREATCTTTGIGRYTCACGASKYAIIELTAHTWGDDQVSEDGLYVYHECTVCGEVEIIWTDPSVHTHTPGEAVIENEVEATCTEDGSYDEVVYCTEDGEELSRETVIVPATGHTPGETVRENEVPATETEDGSYDEVTYCTVCGEELSRETVIVPATGHTPGETVIENEVEATCTEDGSYDEVVYCTEDGEELSRETVTVPATGHTPGETVIENEVEATCTEDGSYDEVTYCTVCGEELTRETVVVPATGVHTPGETVIENKVEATCTEDGSYDEVVYCTVCGEELSRETVIVEATGAHTPGETVIENEVEATCTEDGSYDEVVYCTVCGEELSRETVIVEATGHNYGSGTYGYDESGNGVYVETCANCGDEKVTIVIPVTTAQEETPAPETVEDEGVVIPEEA